MARSKHTTHDHARGSDKPGAGTDETTSTASAGTETADGTASAAQEAPGADMDERVREAERRTLLAQAELQNLKRRQVEEIKRIQDTATESLVISILPVVDDLERALEAAATTSSPDALRSGVELTLNKLLAALRTAGVERLPGVGAAFDPKLHEAVLQTPPTNEHPNGTISQELRAGYSQHGHVIRPSMVAVAHE